MPRWRFGLIALALVHSSCIPVAMFPSEHRIAGGVVGGRLRQSNTEPIRDATGAAFTYRGAIAPLAMVRALKDRDLDFDLGYLIAILEGGSLHHGPTAALSFFAVRESLDSQPQCGYAELPDCASVGARDLFRLAVRAELDMRFTPAESEPGLGARAGLRFDFSWLPERAEAVTGVGPDAGFVGGTWGEGGVAIDVVGGGGAIGGQSYWEFVVALTLRAPAVAGFVFVLPWAAIPAAEDPVQ